MSIPLVPDAGDGSTVAMIARAVVPIAVALAVTALVLVAVRAQPASGEERDARPASGSTPYSEMHAAIPRPDEPEEQPPTF
jgi:hypothetical protein